MSQTDTLTHTRARARAARRYMTGRTGLKHTNIRTNKELRNLWHNDSGIYVAFCGYGFTAREIRPIAR